VKSDDGDKGQFEEKFENQAGNAERNDQKRLDELVQDPNQKSFQRKSACHGPAFQWVGNGGACAARMEAGVSESRRWATEMKFSA